MSYVIRRDAGIHGYERGLHRAGFRAVAGVDEAGRGACAGPLVAGAVILPERPVKALSGLADSKLLSPGRRDRLYDAITEHALAWATAFVPPAECDRMGMHEANLDALRRAVWRLGATPDFVLSDGFPVPGLGAPNLAVWKGDRVAACIAAASIVAKVTRDRVMIEAAETWPDYAFEVHKGYCTPLHQERLDAHGPCEIHRLCFDNVVRAIRAGADRDMVAGK